MHFADVEVNECVSQNGFLPITLTHFLENRISNGSVSFFPSVLLVALTVLMVNYHIL